MSDVRSFVARYRASVLVVIRVASKQKRAAVDDWSNPDFTNEVNDFGPDDNVAIRLDKHIVIDCEDRNVTALAHRLLPPTARMHGRASLPDSHLWYHAHPEAKYKQFLDTAKDADGHHLSVVEILTGRGHYVLAPPSIHPSGEDVTFNGHDGESFTLTDYPVLLEGCTDVAIGGLVFRHWDTFGHHSMAFLAGTLLQHGVKPPRVRALFKAMSEVGPGLAHAADFLPYVERTVERFEAGEEVAGRPKLAESVSPELIDRILSWLPKQRVPVLRGYRGDELMAVTFPPRRPVLTRLGQPYLADGDIGELFATRGVGKTWFLMTVALAVSNGHDAMGFTVPERRRVLYVDGEMARQDIQGRFKKLCDDTGLKMNDSLTIVAADWQEDFLPRIDTTEGQAALEPFVKDAELVIFDNRSCLFDPEGEKDPSAWQPTQDYLLSLRKRGKVTFLAHHANRQGGARGLGKPEDVMNLVMKLFNPEGYTMADGARFICDITPPDGKGRGIWGPAAAPFGLRLTDKGWKLEAGGRDPNELQIRQQIIDYLNVAAAAGDPPKSANAALKTLKCNRQKGLKVWGEMLRDGEIVGDKKTGFVVGVLKVPVF